MSAESDNQDVLLLGEIGMAIARTEPVPDSVIRQAREAYAWRDVAAVIACLEYDSLLDDDGLARVRSSSDERTLVFAVEGTTLRLSLLDGGRRLAGQLKPADFGRVELRQQGRSLAAEVDDLGRFLVGPVTGGAFSLRCAPRIQGGPVVETEWVTI